MTDPIIAQKAPYATDVVAGKSYFWCACGKSTKQPFCDGSHADTGIKPVKYDAAETRKVFFCGCKASNSQPMCDGSHNGL
ncbi:MAG: CDGSH-type Zn-finger protein [Candidatus Azotimanducaceae bacterium]|jgi:CDGSH-type Zn-finger protein